MSMKKIKITIGLSDNQGKVSPEIKAQADILEQEISKVAGGCTVIPATGYYTNEQKKTFKETSRIIEVVLFNKQGGSMDEYGIKKAVQEFLHATNQECCMYEVIENPNIIFLS